MATILIIDDHEPKRKTLVGYAEDLGHQTLEAENGLEGLAQARLNRPDLILLDFAMPVMNGMEFMDQRQHDSTVGDIPVIMITARDSKEFDIAKCIQQGAEDILQMPPRFEILKARVGNCLTRRLQHKREVELNDQMQRSLLNVRDAERRADRLLHSIFPKDAVRELRETNTIAPRRHEDVAVLFCDVVGFTPYCESHQPDEIVETLEALVGAQEQVAEQYGVEKIKTIGDCFMGVAGLHESGDAALLDCVRCAIEFIKLPKLLALGCQVRAGVHAGPVVAGKVGQRKYSYDLWGDTVNTAARIQTRAAPETVFVSAAVWKRISNRSTGISQGLVELKGKGQTELFRVDAVALATAAVAKAEPVGAVLAQS